MDDKELFEETKHKIWLSVYANNNPKSDFHWHADTIYDEWIKRKGKDQIEYAKAYDEVCKN